MVIRRTDRISTVLKVDASLVEVFVALSPAFERLRNPAMRKVMTRLITVEQVARMAGVDADELVARLNAGPGAPPAAGPSVADEAVSDGATGTNGNAAAEDESPAATVPLPPPLARIDEANIIDLDVRDDLRSGREPFSRIMAARSQVPPGGALRLRAIFEPVPLYAVMAKFGFAHHTVQLGPEDWQVWFYTSPEVASVPAATIETAQAPAPAADEPDENVVVLDVRGLEPPEPMVQTLAALETLPPGATLVQLNVRVPQFLLPQLEERGFEYEIREQSPDLVRVFIRRAPQREPA